MSKVHEALKRAQEERACPTLEGSEQRLPAPEVRAPQIEEISLETVSQPTLPKVAVPASEEPPTAHEADPKRTDRPKIPAVLKVPALPLSAEHRPHAPLAGRDPRTGQFLRFEDLLKSCAEPAWVIDPKTVVFSGPSERQSGTEQFRTLRSRLYQLRETASLKRILVTSALAAEGKTFVATNLAQAIACERDRKVLLIDADLRSPALHKPLAAPLSPGLSDYLRGQASDPEIIQHGQIGNLCFIPAGNPGRDLSELLSNGALEKLLERLAPLFDWVVIDSPPCLPVADANILASMCDGVLLVLRARSTGSAAAEKARKELQKRKLIGVVLNGVDESDTYGGYYGYGQPGERSSKGEGSGSSG